MENDVLRNKIAPWQEKGRWYHAFYDNVTGSFDNSKTDRYILDNFMVGVATGVNFIYSSDPNIRILDYVFDAKGQISSNTTTSIGYRYFSSGAKGAAIGSSSTSIESIDIWLFVNVE